MNHYCLKKRLNNVDIGYNWDQIQILVSDKSVNIILLYDVLHLVESREWNLNKFFRILKPDEFFRHI